ncbi:MAG: hypothetical protein OXC68_08365 [Aestuariivita sp.]|nr:hypothetical protein [Aestuariivita sp.]
MFGDDLWTSVGSVRDLSGRLAVNGRAGEQPGVSGDRAGLVRRTGNDLRAGTSPTASSSSARRQTGDAALSAVLAAIMAVEAVLMPTVNDASLRQTFIKVKEDIAVLKARGTADVDALRIITLLITLMELLMAILLEKTTLDE